MFNLIVASCSLRFTQPTDLQRALKFEPNNEAVKAELVRVDELILSRTKGKGKTVRPFPSVLCTVQTHVTQRSAPVEVPTPPPLPTSSPSTSTTTAPPKRRRVPITIIDDDTPQPPGPPSTSANALQPTKDLLNPISSRVLSPTTPTPTNDKPMPTSTSQSPTTQKPTPASFREAKQARDAKSVGRVGGGIFRMSGNDTVFKTREVPTRPVSDTLQHPASAPTSAPAPATGAPQTLFEFTRAWDRIPSSDTAARWALLNVRRPSLSHVQCADPFASPLWQMIHPTSLPALIGASLEPTLLASLIPVLAAGPEHTEATPRDTVRAYMCALTRVQRFKTVVLFLSSAERNAARAVWDAVVRDAGDASGAGNTKELEDAARMWGFAES